MKKLLTILVLLFLLKINAFAQGRVVINEYFPWTANGCPDQSEYVELFNFGPGPMNIGCYILSEGEFSITIPPNTIINAGQYFMISGVDAISSNCSNSGKQIKTDLNWNKCNCMSSTNIPANGGLFTDGGGAREQVVLMDPELKIVDAIVRELPREKSAEIKTSSLAGGCVSKTFALDPAVIPFETIGSSTGRANSYARKIDGDCEWVKDANQSPGAPNSKGGTSSINYSLTITNTMDCNDKHGSISIGVEGTNVSSYFPMNYILAYDIDNDGSFTSRDQYTDGIDNTSPRVEVGGLKAGRYKITLSSVAGCNLKTFDFAILPCQGPLPLQVLMFKHVKTQQSRHSFEWTISDAESMQTIDLEQSIDNNTFTIAAEITAENNSRGIKSFSSVIPVSENKFFRLRITLKNGATLFSSTINTYSSVSIPVSRLWPNPSKDLINIETGAMLPSLVNYKIYNLQSSLVKAGTLKIGDYQYSFALPIHDLPKGLYQLFVYSTNANKPISFRFVKE